MATYDLTQSIPNTILTGDILNCPYSGNYISITLPEGTYKLEIWGAEGGYRSNSSYSGKGGYSVGTLSLTTSTVVYLYSGGSGNSGGYNGGGTRGSYKGGGGGSDIRISNTSLYARVIVAGGGGSDGASNKTGGYGGGTIGGSATKGFGSGGQGGTQTSGGTGASGYTDTSGSFGKGGDGRNRSSGHGGAGGGGWYGGAGIYPDGSGDDDKGGGGGSGYVYNSSTASNYPSGCLLTSIYYLSNSQTIDGNTSFTSPSGSSEIGHSGNGYCRITAIDIPIKDEYMNINKFTKIYIGEKEISNIYLGNTKIR